MPAEASLNGYTPENVLPTAKWLSGINAFSRAKYLDNYEPFNYDWDHYRGYRKSTWKYQQAPSILPARVEVAFNWAAPTTTYFTLETEKTLERWDLSEACPNELSFGLAEAYVKGSFNNLDSRGTIQEPETRLEILRRQYLSEYPHEERSADLFKPQFVLVFSGEDKLQLPDALRIRDGRIIAKPSQLPFRTVGQIDVEASRKRMAYVTAREKGGGSPQEIDLRKTHSVQRAVDHLMRLRSIIDSEFSDISCPLALKVWTAPAT
ncbi:MAG: hypothetical protein WCV81_04420 [Microgenomates group bacterium]|jgi:hypothetical protein